LRGYSALITNECIEHTVKDDLRWYDKHNSLNEQIQGLTIMVTNKFKDFYEPM
jgi:hypothetical protein